MRLKKAKVNSCGLVSANTLATSAMIGLVCLSHYSNCSRFNNWINLCPNTVSKSQRHFSMISKIAKKRKQGFFHDFTERETSNSYIIPDYLYDRT